MLKSVAWELLLNAVARKIDLTFFFPFGVGSQLTSYTCMKLKIC